MSAKVDGIINLKMTEKNPETVKFSLSYIMGSLQNVLNMINPKKIDIKKLTNSMIIFFLLQWGAFKY